ncbi:hypothetical protein B0H17DRAFT_1197987 [Mycena rosella]|uniref:TNT domain-containing protein n=1 Tax=Mycena rosella TaxID=1033263 RepID=A0AAD7DP91_MYCRO|nr:hypothetical protein B0H17DRAFT_1197987 [Mycena rosella]
MYFSLSHLFGVLLLSSGIAAANKTSHCDPTFCNGTEFMSKRFLCGDPRLGPKHLPASSPFASILSGYHRLGGLCPDAFLKKWFNNSDYTYFSPPSDGFQLSTAHKPIAADQVLQRGMLVDCFGTLYETFLFPAGTPFSMRSLPPSSLNTPTYDDIAAFNYRVYRVEYPFVVTSGPIAAFFGQSGQGMVYKTRSTIDVLLQGGLLTRVDERE